MRNCVLFGLGLWLSILASLIQSGVYSQEPAPPIQEPAAPLDTKAIDAELDKFRDDLFHAFNTGDYAHAARAKNEYENISWVLYPNDSTPGNR